MKNLLDEINCATYFKIAWNECDFIEYLINKKGFDFCFEYYSAGKEIVRIFNGNELIGILHVKFPIGFIVENFYENFIDLNFYHLVKINSLDKAEWYVNKEEMKKIAPEITWLAKDEAVNPMKFSLLDLEYATS